MTLGIAIIAAVAAQPHHGLQLGSLGAGYTKAQVSAAAAECQTSVTFVDLPADLAPVLKASFGFNLNANATPRQQKCMSERIPTARTGIISEPPTTKKKN